MTALFKSFPPIDVNTRLINFQPREEPDMLKMLTSIKSKLWLV